jgi:hypothetical protein
MAGIDPGEFGRGAAAREDARADRERAVLDAMLSAGWNRTTVMEARRLHEDMASAVARSQGRVNGMLCNETALGLVGEARGAALADWWAESRGLDDQMRQMLRDCAAAAAALAMVDGFLLASQPAPVRSNGTGSVAGTSVQSPTPAPARPLAVSAR